MTHKKVGDFPTNARIKINYPEKEGEKPTIDFQYPDNERQLKGLWSSSGIILPAMILTVLTIFALYFAVYEAFPIQHPLNCTGQVLTNNVTLETTGINLYCNNITKYYFITYQRTIYFGEAWVYQDDSQILGVFALAGALIIIYFGGLFLWGKLLSLIIRNTKFGKENYPGWNKKIHDKCWEAKFTECPDTLTLEVPLFSNIYMDYDAEEEFADYLESFEIKEHDFTYYPAKGFKLRKYRRNKMKGVPNVYLWKAIFKFRKKPTKGFLKVNWT